MSRYPQYYYRPPTSMGEAMMTGFNRFGSAIRSYIVDLNPATILAAVLVAVLAVLFYDFMLHVFVQSTSSTRAFPAFMFKGPSYPQMQREQWVAPGDGGRR